MPWAAATASWLSIRAIPDIVYAGSYFGDITRYDLSAPPGSEHSASGAFVGDLTPLRYRFAPPDHTDLFFSPHDPNRLPFSSARILASRFPPDEAHQANHQPDRPPRNVKLSSKFRRTDHPQARAQASNFTILIFTVAESPEAGPDRRTTSTNSAHPR